MKALLTLLIFSAKLASAKPPLSCPEVDINSTVFEVENAKRIIPKNRLYTQGLVFKDGFLYESTGLYGRSKLYEFNPQNSQYRLIHSLPPIYFGEGLAYLNETFYQLTWRERTAFVYSLDQVESGDVLESGQLEKRYYSGQGWGLTNFRGMLLKSDGTSRLSVLNPETLNIKSTIDVNLEEQPVDALNELENVKGLIFANLYVSQNLVVIDPDNGCVVKMFDLSELFDFSFPDCEKCGQYPSDYVANGIAYDPESGDLYLTGKNWPYLFVFNY